MKSAILLLLASASAVLAQDKLAFVYEAVRHGARAPQQDVTSGFQVSAGALTSSGMRQRILLGKLNRERYVNKYKLIDPIYNPSQINVQCTNVFRVMQSSYSELMGLYPPSYTQTLNHNEQHSLKHGKGMPPIKIRMSKHAQEKLGVNAIIDGYTFIPVYNYVVPNKYDDLNWKGCNYAKTNREYKYYREESYSEFSPYALSVMKKPVASAFSLNQSQEDNMTYTQFYNYSDIMVAEMFEGNARRYNFTELEWFLIRNAQKVVLLGTYDDDARQLWITRNMRKPIQQLMTTVQKVLNNTYSNNDLKYIIHSSHDTQLLNILQFWQPQNYDPVDQPYASTFYFELHYDQSCLSSKKDTSCFTVEVYSNGLPIKLDTCITENSGKSSSSPICSYEAFISHFNKLAQQGNIEDLCAKTYTPPTTTL